jgi:hypothetical protein
MGLPRKYYVTVLKDLGWTYLIGLAIIAFAIVLALIKGWCEDHQLSIVVVFISVVEYGACVFDGILVLGITAIVTIRSLNEMLRHGR